MILKNLYLIILLPIQLLCDEPIINKEKFIEFTKKIQNNDYLLSGQYFYNSTLDIEKIYSIANDYPAIVESSLWQMNWGSGKTFDAGDGGLYWTKANQNAIKLSEYSNKGSIISLHIPIPNPKQMSNQKDLDLTLEDYINSYTNNGNMINANLNNWLNKLILYIKLIDSKSKNMILILRPLHERGAKFWWGEIQNEVGSIQKIPADNYKALFHYIVNFIKTNTNLENKILITYSMHSNYTEDIYYPGDNYVDFIGLDIYRLNPFDTYENIFTPYKDSYVDMIKQISAKYSKPIYVSELGWNWDNNKIEPYTIDVLNRIINNIKKNKLPIFAWVSWQDNNSPINQVNAKELYINKNVLLTKDIIIQMDY